uniref:Uncharacterized protein n=1 Tax=Cacopsylla melanoneura TaxID=428564 RepID=A0A8D8TVS3_9HEMI
MARLTYKRYPKDTDARKDPRDVLGKVSFQKIVFDRHNEHSTIHEIHKSQNFESQIIQHWSQITKHILCHKSPNFSQKITKNQRIDGERHEFRRRNKKRVHHKNMFFVSVAPTIEQRHWCS